MSLSMHTQESFLLTRQQAAGSTGSRIVAELLRTGKHEVTAITRADSTSTFPPGVKVAKVNYDDPATITAALQGQHALVITLHVAAPKDTQAKLITAAASANVAYVLPNTWGVDTEHASSADLPFAGAYREAHDLVERLGVSAWIDFACGMWYEYGLAGTIDRFGFDFDTREVVLYDGGTARQNVSTWEQIGRAVAGLLSLDEAALAEYRNRHVYVSSFFLSQEDMFASVLRVTGTQRSDWRVREESSRAAFEEGKRRVEGGEMAALAKMLYGRMFVPEEDGDAPAAFQKRKELLNGVLGLPQEDLDACTRAGIEMRKEFEGPFFRGGR